MRKCKKWIAMVLTLVLLVTALPMNSLMVFAADGETDSIITVENSWGEPGSTIDVNVVISGNPGILAAELILTYDDGLTLTSAKSGDAFSALDMARPGQYVSPCKFAWDAQDITEEDVKDGTILTLSFAISETAAVGEELGVSITCDNIYDKDLNDLEIASAPGTVKVIDYTPGDLNEDGKISTADVILLRRDIVGGYNITINENAGDVNEDGKRSTADVVLIRRYIAGGYGVILKPCKEFCSHTMEAHEAAEPACEAAGNIAYWYCTSCEKYFSDAAGKTEITQESTVIEATGHTEVIDPAVEPSYTSTGLTQGSHCSVCGDIIVPQEIVPALQKDEYAITFHIANSDTYLASIEIENPNPSKYTKQDGLVLEDLIVPGYNFKGWYTAQTGGTRVSEIAAGSTGNKVFYAQWEKVEYTVTFDSPDVPVDSVTYTVDKGVTLTNPSWFGYTFVGWSQNGKIVSIIPPGTVGNITLHANWTSNRNKAKTVSSLDAPLIVEDMNNGRFLFVYEIGTIENVPLNQIEYLGNTDGIEINREVEYKETVHEDFKSTITNAVSNAATTTSSWTLAEEWNESTAATNEHDEEIGKTSGQKQTDGTVTGSQYYISNVNGGTTSSSSSAGGSTSSSSKVTTSDSKGINDKYYRESELDTSVDLNVETKVGASYGVVSAEVSAGASSNVSTHDKETFEVSTSREQFIGTYNENNSNANWDVSNTATSSWNTTQSFQNSSTVSQEKEISSTISEVIHEKYGYTSTEGHVEENSETYSNSEAQTKTDEYSTTIEYGKETETTEKQSVIYTSNVAGYYRLVTAGTLHCFAVVGYDIATNSYFTSTYNILDENTYVYLDYSKDNASFNDCENGILPFEVPYEVHEFISGTIAKSSGLVIDEATGIIEEYNGTAADVVIPEYISVKNPGGGYSAIRVTGFAADVFKGNTNITSVALPKYITDIPESAFEGCNSLKYVSGYGIRTIGANAFKGCTSLGAFAVDEYIEALGSNAFEGVSEITVKAANADIADAAINSGAKSITLNISNMAVTEESSFDNKKIVVDADTAYFALISDGDSYSNLQIESDAAEMLLSNMKFVNNTDVPLKLNSAKVTLSNVTVEDTPGFAMILEAEHTDLALYGTIVLDSVGENAVISKSVTLAKANPEVVGRLRLTGDYLICGDMTNNNLCTFTEGTDGPEGEIISITEEEFNNMLTSCFVTFDANEGTVSETQMTVYYGQAYGTLPVPTREYHTFLGWYTQAEGGTLVTEETLVDTLVNHTLYAQWELNVYTVEFDANGGTVEETSRIVPCGTAIGTLPVPERTGYNFVGWFTADDVQITEETLKTAAETISVTAKWSAMAYKVSWETGTGYTITVNRTSSPYVNAATGALASDDAIYYGDVLSISYSAATGYTLKSNGATDITVTGDVTTDDIYASADANSYTYKVVYKSVNGTDLGSTEVTYKYGTTNTITAPAKSGYNTPASQSVKWDSTSAKTITFTYPVTSVSTTKTMSSGNWYIWDSVYGVTYSAYAEYQNRTATSVQVRVVWTNTLNTGNQYSTCRYGFAQYYTANIGGTSTGEQQIAASSLWNYQVSTDQTATKASGWITVPVSATARTVSVSATYRDLNGISGSWSNTMAIPTY